MIRKLSKAAVLAVVVMASLSLVGCSSLKAKQAFKDANGLYGAQDYKKAAARYEDALKLDPNLTAAYFFLGNSYDNMYKPSHKGEAENDAYLAKAVENYRKAAQAEQDPKIKKLALEYLVAAYGPDKLNDPTQAEPVVMKMIELDPKDTANYFALAKIYEDAGNYEQAEGMLLKAKQAKPSDAAVYMQLAGYYNRQGEFDKTIQALQERAQQEPNNPEAFYTIATYYWDKAYRDFRLNDADKKAFVEQGVQAVDKALQLKPDYMEAMVYKNLLLRLEANLEKDAKRQAALLKEADALRDKAQELRKQKAQGTSD